MTSIPKHLKSGSECPPLKEKQLRLYSMHYCPYAQRAKLVLAAKNIPYEEININLVEKPEWYLAKNAPGQVPSLEWIDNNTKEIRFIPESLIVSDFLDETNPENRLQPNDQYVKAQHRVLIERSSNITTPFYKILRSGGKEGCEDLNKNLKTYEDALNNTYFGGSKPAMVDYMLWPWFERFPLLNDAGFQLNADGKLPKLAAWTKAMEANETVQKVKVPLELMKKFMNGYLQGKVEYDFE
ncbi:unnamed protein product [Rotaria sordida]|uniref:Glutathione S-transferase omega n=1 Tax=Rotaria sordida TaxID=392033 RepID=A0A815WIV6_9BILA|nr:unnamed protein product [Rotaria sordida]CAF1548345.1 unnamed protein product [Rotaria sordida]